ncbi:hypothetical protein ANCCAN_01496 [Ancylostoma caninum]|uniref:Uncharacterized protein n=1 Tax=Ancylostoma caninum TaxID=29170 RepID=A0A368H788_ANCCA|nr:hypothetical protein ANCCAN_01496 [Ancylostoma caninum]
MRSLFAVFLATGFVTSIKLAEDVFSCFLYYPSRFLERSGTHSEGRVSNVSICLERCLEVRL